MTTSIKKNHTRPLVGPVPVSSSFRVIGRDGWERIGGIGLGWRDRGSDEKGV